MPFKTQPERGPQALRHALALMMKIKNCLYIWTTPLMWTLVSVLLYFYPGDEYGCFYIGTQPASWITLYHHFGSMTGDFMVILPIGMLVFMALGFCLDRMRTRNRTFYTIFLVVAFGFFYCFGIADLGSLDRIQRKYSILGFAGLSCNVALCSAIVVLCVVHVCKWLWQMSSLSKRQAPGAKQG